MIKIAYFNDGPLLPIKEGGAEKIINQIRFQNIKKVSEIILFECERPWTNMKLLAKEHFKSVILPENVFYSNSQQLSTILSDLNIQACIFTNPETLLNVGIELKKLQYKIIYDCHNVFSLFAKRIGQQQNKVDWIHFMEYTVGQIADLILPCSEVDLQNLIKIGIPKEKLKIIENGVDIKKIEFIGPNLESKTILFLGNVFYQPNLNAIRRIYEFCYKSELLKDYKFINVGSVPKDVVKKYQSKNFQFLGYIPDLNTVFKNATVAIAPLTEGSGTRLKIINYLAAGIPTISSKLGIEGLDLTSKEIFISDEIKDYPEIINEIIANKEYKDVIDNGREKIETKYDWRVISNRAIKYYSELLKK